jgi:transcriptional regulator with XRE-family HTH domain
MPHTNLAVPSRDTADESSQEVTPLGAGRYILRGEEIITCRQVCKELGWVYERLAGMQVDCPFFDDEVLLIRSERLPVTGIRCGIPVTSERSVGYITVAKFEGLKRKLREARGGRLLHKGKFYLSPQKSLAELRVATGKLDRSTRPITVIHPNRQTLRDWHALGCTYLNGDKLGGKRFGGAEVWFEEEHILRIKAAILKAINAAKDKVGSFSATLRKIRLRAGLTLAGLSEKTGIAVSTMHTWQRGSIPTPRMAKKLAVGLGVPLEELRLPSRPKQRRPHWHFDGKFRENGRVVGYNLRRAAAESGFCCKFLEDAAIKLAKPFRGIFPKGCLPTELMLVPGTTKCWQAAVRPDDLDTLKSEIARILRTNERRVRGLLTREAVFTRYGVVGRAQKAAVAKLLSALTRNGHLTAERLPLPRQGNTGMRHRYTPRLYDPEQIDTFLAGRKLLDVAKQFTLEPGSMEWPATEEAKATTATPGQATEAKKLPRKRRGRPKGTIDPRVTERNAKMREAWKSGAYPSKAALGRAFKVSRSVADEVVG